MPHSVTEIESDELGKAFAGKEIEIPVAPKGGIVSAVLL